VLFALAGIVVILLLSVQLLGEKRVSAALRAEIARSTRSVVPGAAMPPLEVLPLERSGAVNLRDLCGQGRSLAVYFWAARCQACEHLRPRWSEARARRPDWSFVFVSVGEMPIPDRSGLPDAVHALSTTTAVHDAFGIRELPAVFLVGRECQLLGAGVGRYAAEAVLSSLASAGGP
jgi:hypothetical protein